MKKAGQEIYDSFKAVTYILGLVKLKDRFLVILGLFISNIFGLLGITMIIPLLAILSGAERGKFRHLKPWMESIGIPFEPYIFLTAIVVFLTLKSGITIIVMRYVSRLVSSINGEFRLSIIQSLMRARWGYFVQMRLGRLIRATGTEPGTIGNSFLQLATLLSGFLQVSVFILVGAIISWQLALISIAVAIVMALSSGKLARRSRAVAKQLRSMEKELATNFTDAVVGIKPLRAMGRTDRFSMIFEKGTRRLAKSERKKINLSEFSSELQEPIVGAGIAFGFYIAMSTLSLNITALILMTLLLVKTIGVLGTMQKSYLKLFQNYDQFTSLVEFLNRTQEAKEPDFGTKKPSLGTAIRFDAISFSYGKRIVLNDISLDVEAGEITTIAGRSGIGKTTLVDLLVGLHHPTTGRILIDDIALDELDLARWRDMVGYVPQEVTLFHDSVLQNVKLWDKTISEFDVIEALKAAGAWDFIQSLPKGLAETVGERGNRFSGGQRQRISLARALVFKPRLLILDEATTGLDPDTEKMICERVRDLCTTTGLTVLAISHQPLWQDVADRVYFIEDSQQTRSSRLETAEA